MQVKNINLFLEGTNYYKVDLNEFTVRKIAIEVKNIDFNTINFYYCDMDISETIDIDDYPLTLFFTEAEEAYRYCKDYLEGKIRKQRIELASLELSYNKLNDKYLDLMFVDTYHPKMEY